MVVSFATLAVIGKVYLMSWPPIWAANARFMLAYSLAMSRMQRRNGVKRLKAVNMNFKHKIY